MARNITHIAVRDAELMNPISSTVYCTVKSGSNTERSENLNVDPDGTTLLIFNTLIGVVLQSKKVMICIHELSNGFTDDVIGECILDVDNPSEDNRYIMRSYNKQDKVFEVVGSLYASIENMEYHKGKTFRKARDFLESTSSDDLSSSNIADRTATKSVAKVIREIIRDSLTEADLSCLKLSSCPAELSQIAVTTRKLDLGFNQFTQFPDVSFLGFQYLEDFALTGNKLKEIPPSIGQLGNLLGLHLNGNMISTLPREIGQLQLLERLDLSNNQLESLIPEIGYLTNLQDLLLCGNKIQKLPRSIGRCVSMEVMDLSSCELLELPNEFTKMTKLMELNISNNQLRALPSNIGRMTRLVSLNVSDNSLRDLPLSIGYCQGLMQCYLDRNPIQDRDIIAKSKIGTDHLVDYLETRMLSYMSERGINPQKMQSQMENQERQEREAQEEQMRLEEERKVQEKEAEEARIAAAIEQHKQEMLAQASPQEQAIIAKLNQAKNMGTVIFSDCMNRIANLEMFIGQVASIRQGLPFSRAVDGIVPDLEGIQRVIGYQPEPAVPRVSVGFASPQLQNFKHSMLIKLAHSTVCITAAVPYLQQCDDAQSIVTLVKLARSMNYKLTNIM